MADEIDIPHDPGAAPAPAFDQPPPSVAQYEAIPLAHEPPDPDAVRWLFTREDADRAELLLARITRARGAVDLDIGEGLAALQEGDRLAVLCCSSIGDYAREALGIAPRTAQNMARLARELRRRPLLRAAVRAGEVTVRRAQAVLPLAIGEAEEEWVERARVETVRALEKAAREAGASEDGEEWARLGIRIEPEDRAKLDRALSVAGRILGATSTRWQRLEAMGQEYLGSHPVEEVTPRSEPVFRFPFRGGLTLEERLEAETACWSSLVEPAPHAAEEDLSGEADPGQIDWRLRELNAKRVRWDAAIGWLALVIKRSKVWRFLGFASFAHYCKERLGLSARTVEQRIALEKRLWELPALREAVRDGLSYEKARLVAGCPDDQVPAAIDDARRLTCIALRRQLEAKEDAQMRARRVFTAFVPESAAWTLATVFRAVRAEHGAMLPTGKCLAIIAEEFLATHEPTLPRRKTPSSRARERDQHLCQVPGCSRAAMDAHHRRFRSRGGGHELPNLVSVCSFHHLRCLHMGRLSVIGEAPDRLLWFYGTWSLGIAPEALVAEPPPVAGP